MDYAPIEGSVDVSGLEKNIDGYDLRRFKVLESSQFHAQSLRSAGIQQNFGCIVVGIESRGKRIQSPRPDTTLQADDVVWVVGDGEKLQDLGHAF